MDRQISDIRLKKSRIIIDAREFVQGRFTGIGRVLEGLIGALSETDFLGEITLIVNSHEPIPPKLKSRKKIEIKSISSAFLKSEKVLSNLLKRNGSIFLSPYPKLPLFGCQGTTVHIIHDVLDLTHPVYRKRFKVYFDKFRLKRALNRADLTWYDSVWSLEETRKLVSFAGRNPRVRYPGINEIFNPKRQRNEDEILKKYNLEPGYILVLGNGMPHKNLGVLLETLDQISRRLVFVGVSQQNQRYWEARYPRVARLWVEHAEEEDLPSIIRGAFCLAQPSTAEGYGYPPLEAMACGIPAVISNIPVLVETTGNNALIADPKKSTAWAQAFKDLENKTLYQNKKESGLKWIQPLQGPRAWHEYITDIENLLFDA